MPIIVGDVEITDDEVHAEMQYHPAESIDDARHKAAEALVIRQLFLQEAAKKQLLTLDSQRTAEKEEEAIDQLIYSEINVPEIDEKSCMRYYKNNQDRFRDKKNNDILPFEYVSSYISQYLHVRSLRTGINQYIKLLSGKTRIIGFNLEGSDSPLVQ